MFLNTKGQEQIYPGPFRLTGQPPNQIRENNTNQ